MSKDCYRCAHLKKIAGQRCCGIVNMPISKISSLESMSCNGFEFTRRNLYERIKEMQPMEIVSRFMVYEKRNIFGKLKYMTTVTGDFCFSSFDEAKNAAYEKIMFEYV